MTSTEPVTIDMTPTWAAVLPILLAGLEKGTAQGRKMSREELARMAQAADQANAAWKAHGALLAAVEAIVEEAGPSFGKDGGLGTINTMSRIARQALAAKGQA